jgi:hypothetical protein
MPLTTVALLLSSTAPLLKSGCALVSATQRTGLLLLLPESLALSSSGAAARL